MENKKGKLGSRLAGSEAFLSVAASLVCIVIGLHSAGQCRAADYDRSFRRFRV